MAQSNTVNCPICRKQLQPQDLCDHVKSVELYKSGQIRRVEFSPLVMQSPGYYFTPSPTIAPPYTITTCSAGYSADWGTS